jgi:hypothetical protein
MLLINLATIYQGAITVLRHAQAHAHHLSQIHLRYNLTGELDPSVPKKIQELNSTDQTLPWPPTAISLTPQVINIHKSQRTRHKPTHPHPSPPPPTRKKPRQKAINAVPHLTHHTSKAPRHSTPPPITPPSNASATQLHSTTSATR